MLKKKPVCRAQTWGNEDRDNKSISGIDENKNEITCFQKHINLW